MQLIYLDYAAATPVNSSVLEAMKPYFTDVFYNPSALYSGSRTARAALDEARGKVAQHIGARPSEIIFTAGGTESSNLAIKGIMQRYPDKKMLLTAIEHDAVMRPAEHYTHQKIAVNEQGIVDTENLLKLLDDDVVLVSAMLVNNEIGTIQPIAEISKLLNIVRRERIKRGNKTPLYLHTDACQAPLYLDVNVARLGVDLMTLNGGKMHGPKQSGMLFVRAGIEIAPLIEGGAQEFGMRHGTENVAFAVGFAQALELAQKGRNERVKHVAGLRDYFMEQLESVHGGVITGSRKHRVANNVHVKFAGADNERVLFALDDVGVAAAAGSACSASSESASHVLTAIGFSELQAQASVRFSLGTDTTKSELDAVIQHLHLALKA